MTPFDISIRPYTDADEEAVVDLLHVSLGGGPGGERTASFFRWKHLDNPFGRSLMLVAEDEQGVVGFRSFLRWEYASAHGRWRAVRAVDTATHPRAQGKGVFTRLTTTALAELKGSCDFVFNTPNEKSLPGYLKMGWTTAGRVPVWIRPRRPLASLRARRVSEGPMRTARPESDSASAAEVLRGGSIPPAGTSGGGLATIRDETYLLWRYGPGSGLDYRAVTLVRGGRRGTAIFRLRPRGGAWEATVAEVLTGAEGAALAGRLLAEVAKVSGADHLSVHFSAICPSPYRHSLRGYVRAPGGMMLVTNRLGRPVTPDPSTTSSFTFSLGDLEVF
ncbi:MAG: GNAT family N-acetyltransferase [Actinomycetota bacterium]